MKELDVLLEQFLLRSETELKQGAWPELEELLQSEDDRLWDWLQNPALPGAVDFYPLLKSIRYGTRS